MLALHGYTAEQLHDHACAQLPRGAGAAHAVYRSWLTQGSFCPEDMGLGALAAAAWRQLVHAELPIVERVVQEEEVSPHGPRVTTKALLRLDDGRQIECVHIPRGRGRFSLCLSSQVGCAMACAFCETGRMGLLRNLTAAEMVAQVLVARHVLGWQVDNLVFMGMGEALDNRAALFQALAILRDRRGLAFASERITICTVGHVPGIQALAAAGFGRIGLAISLNAASDDLRSRIMPINRRWSLDQVQEALIAARPRHNAQLAVHYCLMPGINDRPQDAQAIADFVRPLGRTMIALIPYNPGREPITRSPSDEEVAAFVALLRGHGLSVRRRITKGRSVMAACGQLGTPQRRPTQAVRPSLFG